MAYSKQITIKATLNKSINYITNSEKTDEGLLIYGLNCAMDKKVAYKQMQFTKRQFNQNNGVLGYHFVQSFRKGEIKDIELAHKIGIEWAEKISNGRYQAVVTTHIDKGHIHNHVVMNSVSFKDGKKFNADKKNLQRIRMISDELCLENGLSIIKPKPKNRNKSYKEWLENNKGTSWKSHIKYEIDKVISEADNFEEFIAILEAKGYEVRYKGLKHITFKAPNQKRCVRGKTLGDEYTEESIRGRIKHKEINFIKLKNGEHKKWIDFDVYRFRYAKGTLINNIAITAVIIKNMLGISDNNRTKKYILQQNTYGLKVLRKLEKTLLSLDKEKITTRDELLNKIDRTNEKIGLLSDKKNKLESELEKLRELELKLNEFEDNRSDYEKFNSSIFNKIKYKDKLVRLKDILKELKSNKLDGEDGRIKLIKSQNKQFEELKKLAIELQKSVYIKDNYLENLDVIDNVNNQEYIKNIEMEKSSLDNIIFEANSYEKSEIEKDGLEEKYIEKE